ncbi:MAG: hypothetical protein ABA06_04825 [Parcubacteria bacterium C7867-001]|nr:MAG: hypothetical protein ABA06_04825 [Parcubacteria bacterium C7867-001]
MLCALLGEACMRWVRTKPIESLLAFKDGDFDELNTLSSIEIPSEFPEQDPCSVATATLPQMHAERKNRADPQWRSVFAWLEVNRMQENSISHVNLLTVCVLYRLYIILYIRQ